MFLSKVINAFYYRCRPLIPRWFQIWIRSRIVHLKRQANVDVWPILEKAARPPEGWKGWPEQKRFALVLTHDVDTAQGQDKCLQLMELEKELGFRPAFYFVPERYRVNRELQRTLIANGFEVGVHGLNHDGRLYQSRSIFKARAGKINEYLKAWGSVGFRSPAMHHNLDWAHDLNVEYDTSTFDTDPFEPQPNGVETIFPFWVNGKQPDKGYVEFPYTLCQDFTLFVLMRETDIKIWQQKLDWIAEKGGMALLNTHPDYMNFTGGKLKQEEYPIEYYAEFLNYIQTKYERQYWAVLPKDLARHWRSSQILRG